MSNLKYDNEITPPIVIDFNSEGYKIRFGLSKP